MKRTLAAILAVLTVLSCMSVLLVSAETPFCGDVNGDGKINAVDYLLTKRVIMGTYHMSDPRPADVDGDEEITEIDYMLIKRYVLGTFPLKDVCPDITAEQKAFVLDLQSAVEVQNGKRILTVGLTVKDLKDGVRLQTLAAKLRYDPEEMTLLNKDAKDDTDGMFALDCATRLPGASWENMTRESDEGEIDIRFAGINPAQIITSDIPLTLEFRFEMKEDVTDAEVYIDRDTVKGVFAPGDGSYRITAYHGEVKYTTEERPSLGDLNQDGEINVVDYLLLLRAVHGTFSPEDAARNAADIDGDGEITSTDYLLLKRYVLGYYTIGKTYPVITEEKSAFALDLQSSIEEYNGTAVMAVTAAVKDIAEGVDLQSLVATLSYDPEKLTPFMNELAGDTGTTSLDCVTELPGPSWENLTHEIRNGEIRIDLVGLRPTHIVAANAPLTLTFRFEVLASDEELTVSVDTVKGVCASDSSDKGITVYYGKGGTAAATYTPAETEPEPEPEPSPCGPSAGDLGGNGKIDATDYLLLKRFVLGMFALSDEQKAIADINKDGKINAVDYLLLKRAVLGTFTIA